MIKRFFSLAIMMTFAMVAMADGVITFSDISNLPEGIYLHSGTGASPFSIDAEHAKATLGNFTDTSSTTWSLTDGKVLTCGQGCDLSGITSSTTADATDGPTGSLAFNVSGAGKLYVVYGATSISGGAFTIKLNGSSICSENMAGINYSGPLGTRSPNYTYTMAETVANITGSGTVYIGGSRPYCIYAVLFEPASSIYGVYDFRAMATENVSGTSGTAAINLIDRAETPNGSNTDISGKVTDNGAISIVYRKKSDGTSDFKWGKSENAVETGIMMPRGGRGELSFFINGLKAGDWFKIETGDKHLLFYSSDFYDLNEGASSSVKSGDIVESGHTYVAKKDVATLQLYYDTKQSGYLYIYSVEISNGDAVPAPVISDYDFDTGKVTMTVADSYKGNTPAIYYGIDDAEPTTLYTGPFTVAKACTVKAIAKVGELQSTETKKDIVLEVVSDPVITFAGGEVTITGGSSNAGKSTTIYYTLDASQPTTSSTKYTGAIAITETRIVKAIAISTTGTASNVVKEKAVVGQATPSTIWDFINDAALKPLVWNTEEKINQSYFTSSNAQNSNFLYITNAPIHGQMTWLTPELSKINATTDEGTGLKVVNDGRPFTISDLHEGDAIYITYTTTGDKLKTSKHSSIGNTVTIGTTDVTSGQTEIDSGAKIVVKTVVASNNYVAFMPNKNITIQRIEINPMYKITTTAEHGSISVITPADTDLSSATFAPGTTVTLTATGESSEWVFSHWVVNDVQTTEATLTLTMDSNKTVEAVFSQKVAATGVSVILVAGQSNTDGRIQTAFPYNLNHTLLSYCNGKNETAEGVFTAYGTTPRSDSGERWGYDAVVYDKIQTSLNGEDFYVIKESMGNTAINSASTSGNGTHFWSANPVWLDRNTSANEGGRSLLKGFFGNIDKSLKTLTDGGKDYDIKFLMWHQGEADRGGSFNPEYEKQLKAVINELRNYLVERTGNNKYSNLPVILGGISAESAQYNATVEQAKQNLADADVNIYYVPATGLGLADLNADNQKVHFGADAVKTFGGYVWDVIHDNGLMTGITFAGSDTPAENPLVEDVVSETTTWTFTTTGSLAAHQSMNGLYSHTGTVYEKNYGTITIADNTTVDGTYAATTTGKDRKSDLREGVTAGNSAYTHIYNINVSGEGTLMAVLRPIEKQADDTYARLMFNGEELQAIKITSTSENIQLVGKTTQKGTFTVTCAQKWDLIAMKFIAGASDLEIMTPPTILAGEKVNTIKIIPGTSDLADAVVKTYYTIDDSTPTAESTPYTGADIELTEDCVVRAVSISSKGGKAYSEPYTFEKGIPGQVINASKNLQTCYADDALDFTGITAIEAFIVMAPSDIINTEAKPVNANNALSRGSGDSGIPSGLQLVRVYKVPKGTAFLVKFLDTTNENVTVPYMVTAINGISTATETIAVSENLLKHATQAVGIASGKKLFEASSTADSFVFNGTNSVGAGKYYLDVPTTAVGEMTVSIKIQEENDMPYLVEIDTFEVSESVVYDFANTTDNINVDDKTKTRSLIYKGADKAAGFRYVLNGSEPLRVLTYSNTGGFTQGSGVTVKSSRQFAIEGLKTGDMIRIIHNGTVTDANNASSGTTITDLKGNAITGGIASGQAVKVATADATNNYAVFMANEGDLTIALIAINHAIEPTVEKDVDQSTSAAHQYKVSFYEGETLHYTSPDTSGEQTVSYTGSPAVITVTKNGELKVWTTYGESASEKVTKTIDLSSETAVVSLTAGYQTYYAETTLDFTNVSTDVLRAYIVKMTSVATARTATRASSSSQLEFIEVKKVPAKTALILWGKKATTVEIPQADTSTSQITDVSGTEIDAEVNLLKKAERTETEDASTETMFVPNTDGDLSFDHSGYVSRGGIYLEIPASVISEDTKEISLGEPQEDGTVIPLEITIASVKNITPVLDTENSTKSKKVYIFKFDSSQKLYYKRPGQDTEFRGQSYKDGYESSGFTVNSTYNGYLEYYIVKDGESSRTDAKEIMLAPKATLSKIETSSSTYQIDFFDGATLYYTLGDGAENSVDTGSPFELSVTKGTKISAYSKTDKETTESLSTNLYAPTPSIVSDSVYQFADIKENIGIDYVLTSVGYEDDAIEIGDLSMKVPTAMTSQTLDRFAFSAPRADGKGETSDWRLLNAGHLRASKSEIDKHLLIQGAKKGNMLLLTYSGGATISYVEASSTAKLPENTSTITSNQKYEVQNDGDLLLKIPADTENNCDITVISLSSKYNTSSGEGGGGSSGGSSTTTIKANEPSIAFHHLENDTIAIYRFAWDKNTELHYTLDSEGTEQSGGTSGTYDLPITKDDKVSAWTTTASDTSKVVKATLFAPTPAPGIDGNIDFSEASEDLIADMPLALDMNRKVTVGGETLYFPTELTRNTFNDKFAFSEFSGNKVRIRRNRTLTFAKGDDVKMGILDLKKGDIVAFDFTGKVQIVNSSAVKMESTKSQTRAASAEGMASGEAYIMQHDGNLLLNIALNDTVVVINKMYIAPAPSKSEAAAIDFISAAEDYEDLDFGHSTSVYYYAKANAQSFKMLANDSHELPINNKVSTEGGNGTLTTNGMTAGNRRLAIHNLAVGDEIMLRITSGSVTFEGHEQKGNIITVNGKQLMPQDTLRSGDIIKVEKVNYLYNYVVLKLDSKASVSGIYINAEDEEKVTMPTIVDKGSNTVLITAGQSTTGNQVTTCYTTDGSEPTSMNGTSGPYDEIELHLLGGGMLTIKAVSYTDRGIYSKVASITIYADDLVGSGKAASRSVTGTYDMQGNKVSSVQRGGVYIRDGKKVFFGK